MRRVSKPTYVLLHGAWHGAWCWRQIVKRLEAAGHEVLAPDLPTAPLAAISLELWTQRLCQVLAALAQPVILVGHSRAGIVISQAAERLAGQISRLVYVNGFLLADGESVLRSLREYQDSPLLQHVALSQDKTEWRLDLAQARAMFYQQCSQADAEWAQSQLCAEPAAPLMTPIRITPGRFARVPRTYIHCLRDRAVPLAWQRKMVAALACDTVWEIDTDHSPFLSAPEELTARLLAIQ